MKTFVAYSENLRVDDINLVMIFIVIKDTQIFISETLLIVTIQKSVHSRVKVSE